MPWGHSACVVTLPNVCVLVYVGLTFSILQASPELSEDLCIFNLTLRNFRPVLSWELGNRSIVPTHYTLWYTHMSSREGMKIVEHCTNITRPLCDLSGLWVAMSEMYVVMLVGSRGDTVLVRCSSSIFPEVHMHLLPPPFEITGFMDHINVTLAFPPILSQVASGEALWLHLALVIEEQAEGLVKKHNLKINENTTGNFTYVLDNLMPNTNYCISVYFNSMNLESIRSLLKCTLLPKRKSESSESAKIGGLITMLLIAVVSMSTLAVLRRIGYICLRSVLPKVLNFHNLPSWVFPELPSEDPVVMAEVIHVSRKKKVWDYNYDDESDSDGEAVPHACAGGYTMHGLTGRLLYPASGSSATLQDCSNTDIEEAGLLQPQEAESQSVTAADPRPQYPDGSPCSSSEGQEGRGTPPADPLSEDNSSFAEGSEDRIFFNVDLNSVFVRVLDDSDTEASPASSLLERTVGLEGPYETRTSLALASGQGTQLSFPATPGQGLWPEDAPSDQSDTSESDVDLGVGDGYLMR